MRIVIASTYVPFIKGGATKIVEDLQQELALRECQKVFTNARAVADRLRKFNGVDPTRVLYPPLSRQALFRTGPFGDYLFYPSRLTSIKRQELAIEAMQHTRPEVRLVIAGTGDREGYLEELQRRVDRAGLSERVELTGWISEERKATLM